ncbi:MAG: chemotaxis family two-component system sensor kinase Cph1 [Maribacter sp.]|jgi:chemotaxis family two-component system sensor kinase Cph1
MDRKYTIAIFIAISILVLNQITIQYFLRKKTYDAKTINLSGRQRMLSQKINLEFYKVLEDNQTSTELPQLFKEWKNIHQNLLNNSGRYQLSPIIDPQALELMSNLSLRIDFAEKQLNYLLSNQAIDITKINSNQAMFLADMDKIVMVLEKNSFNKLKFIICIEIFLMLLSISVIMLEVIFIFKPNHQILVKSLNETKKSKEKIEKSLIKLERQNQDLKQFAYVASHDLQEPLRTIISFTQLLHRRYEKQFGKEGKEEMVFIIDATRRMESLINGLLDYAKIGRTRAIKSIDCNHLIDTIKQDLNAVLTEKNAKLNIGKLPKIMGYETEIRQLFQNLIINALEFKKAEIQPSIFIIGEDLGDKFQFSIQDNGIGIEKEYHHQIFSIFKRLHTRNEYNGTGIGLAQCKKIVEHHNGEIWVDSKENEGSIFHFTISYVLKDGE